MNGAIIRSILFIFCFFLLVTCRKDENFLNDPNASLDFSSDSLLFDTVFTTVGSATNYLRVYNRNNKPVKISAIRLAGGSQSNFRLNVDGIPGPVAYDVVIAKKDSLWILVEVTVDPNNQNSPLVIRDSILFELNGKLQDVQLEAWGQDAYYHRPDPAQNPYYYFLLKNCNEVWTNDKPHVIYGGALIDSACSLTMMPGTRVHLHKDAMLIAYYSSLKIKGSQAMPVTIQGDRLEPEYQEIPGQWGKIWLSAGSMDNEIDWAVIKNGSIGVQADTVGSSNPTLRIYNSVIKNMTAASLYGQGSHIQAANCVFANSGQYTAALTIGGKYRFEHCSFVNYWTGTKPSRQTPLLWLNNWYKDINNNIQVRQLDSAYFGNCIIYGALTNEVLLDSSQAGGAFSYQFDHCLVRIDPNTNTNSSHFLSLIKNQDPNFENTAEQNYYLKSSSPAINSGKPAIGNKYPFDLKLKARPNPASPALPDPGAYEYY